MDVEAVELQQEQLLLFSSGEFELKKQLAVSQFIQDVRAFPGIWDQNSPEYDNFTRIMSWRSLCRKLDQNFDNRTELEQNCMIKKLKRKWKSLRSCYNQELNWRKQQTSASKRCRKPYMHFDHLTFLSESSKPHEDSKEDEVNYKEDEEEEEEDADCSIEQHWKKEEEDLNIFDEENQSSRDETADVPRTIKETSGWISNNEDNYSVNKGRRLTKRSFLQLNPDVEISSNQDYLPSSPKTYKVMHHLPDQSPSETNESVDSSGAETTHIHTTHLATGTSKRLTDVDGTPDKTSSYFCEKDEDRLFMLSLVSELKQVPKDLKLDAKMDIIKVIKTYKSKVNKNKH